MPCKDRFGQIIARANEYDNVSKLYRAGADYVRSLAAVSGRMLASIVPEEDVLSPGAQLKLIRTTAPGAVGDSLADADVRNRTGCTIIAAERDGGVVTNPGASFVIETRARTRGGRDRRERHPVPEGVRLIVNAHHEFI